MLFALIKKEKFIFSLVAFGAIGLILALPFFFWQDIDFTFSAKLNAEKVAQFGDFIGGVFGSLWALAGVFLFYKALTEQREDFKNNKQALDLQVSALHQQITEFQLTRDEQVLSRKIYEEQSRTLKTQQFDSNFYSLLNVYLNIKDNLSKNNNDFFKELSNKISLASSDKLSSIDNSKVLVQCYYDCYDENRESLSSYFRSLYRLFNIIDSAVHLNDQEKIFYAKIIRGQISDYELNIIYYNSKSHYGEKFQRYILNYNLLKHLPLTCNPEISKILKKQGDTKLILLSNFISRFLIKNMELYYDVAFSKDKIEEVDAITNIIIGIYFTDKLEIRLYCEKELSKNGLKIDDCEFDFFINTFISEKCIMQTYIIDSKVNIEMDISNNDEYRIIKIIFDTEEQVKINKDKY
ncbi:hypothetical protein DA099_12765 [Photobacterium damselae]|uniref:Uncharacterized protein n=1 Tax=Photobacterium damselae TaxID=38293 RepID=A0ACD3T0Q4_PHODM|nr:putative phage abortive infection protein [Photobacterium damselae]RDL28605.1 hypothetical protein BC461_16165 [Photobacterium damselae]TMX48142.1 hypothetical protein DA099_12765 [Photobacterium damselae]TMX64955.1 hypothetical protein DA090_13295 [Photobacterium damselae]TMX78006.1 hypothetical protein DA092_03740 [Photobacterium damselae]